jgi:hypothetical protein
MKGQSSMKKILLMGIIAILLAGCAVPQSAQIQAVSAAAVVPTTALVQAATRAQLSPLVTLTQTAEAQATATASPTVTPVATATNPSPTATPKAFSPTASVAASGAPSAASVASSAASSATSGVLLPLDSRKYSAPTLLTPDNDATYHVSQSVVHLAWSATSTDLMTFGQTAGCVSDATNFRRAFESYQLVIHSLDAERTDQVQWTENSTAFDLNLTTLPAGRYSWSVNVVTLCESYVVGERNGLHQKSTLERIYVAAASPTSATRIINWVP